MKTWIIDNGRSCSDHALIFIETDAPDNVVKGAVLAMGHMIAGSAEGAILWRAEGTSVPLTGYISLRHLLQFDRSQDELLVNPERVIWRDMDGTVLSWTCHRNHVIRYGRNVTDEPCRCGIVLAPRALYMWLLEHWETWLLDKDLAATKRWHAVSQGAVRTWLKQRLKEEV